MLGTPLQQMWTPRRAPVRPGGGSALFAKDAARMLLGALIATHGKPEQQLALAGAEWANRPLTAHTLIASIDPRVSFTTGRASDTQTTLLWLALDYLGADALPLMLDWLIERPSPAVKTNGHVTGRPAAALAGRFPATEQPLRAAIQAAIAGGDPAKAAAAQGVHNVLEFELRP
jgi:hypothetical protein